MKFNRIDFLKLTTPMLKIEQQLLILILNANFGSTNDLL